MTIAWTGSGGLFTILGAYACATRAINGVRGSTDPASAGTWGSGGPQIRNINTAINNIIAAHSSAQEPYYDGIRSIQDGFKSSQDAAISSLKSQAQDTLISIVNADNPQNDLNLSTALRELIRQMKGATQTVKRCAVAKSVSAGSSNIGDAVVLCSVTGRYGVPLEYAIAETIVVTCTGDANGSGDGATAGSEPLQAVSPAAEGDKFAVNWPDGSGQVSSLSVIDPNNDAGANLLTNSDFETFTTANTPDDWSILVGAAGTDILKDTAETFGSDSISCVQFVGGATLTSIAQTFGAAAGSGTTSTLDAATQYGVCFNLYTDVQPAAGVLKIELVDGSNTVINDDEGTANAITMDLTTMAATTWTTLSGFFRTPTNMPATVKIRIRLSTAMSSGSNLNIDFGAMGVPTQLYAGGPYLIAFRGSTDLVIGDYWNVAITNDRAGIFQTWFEQAFDMSDLGLILPSASSSSINDNLVA